MENITTTAINDVPTVRKQIGKTTYIVQVHFSEAAQETMRDDKFCKDSISVQFNS